MNKLQKLEKRIDDNIKKAWYENGLCLLEIRKDKLYLKNEYKTFEQYLNERWDYSRQRGVQLINSAELYQSLEIISEDKNNLPKNESQVNALLKLNNISEQIHVWEDVSDHNVKITASVVKSAVDEFKENPVEVVYVDVETKLTNVTSSKKDILYSAGNNDECYTPDYAVRAIIPHLNKRKIIWCPFDTSDSNFVKELESEGFTVTCSHISTGHDFYEYEPDKWDIIVSNPPFTKKREIFERALSFGKPFALIMSNTWLNDAAPKQVFKERGLQLLMFEERMKFLNQDNSENKITFSSSYFCCDLLKRDITMESLKNYGY